MTPEQWATLSWPQAFVIVGVAVAVTWWMRSWR
jgi:hypothetical protein